MQVLSSFAIQHLYCRNVIESIALVLHIKTLWDFMKKLLSVYMNSNFLVEILKDVWRITFDVIYSTAILWNLQAGWHTSSKWKEIKYCSTPWGSICIISILQIWYNCAKMSIYFNFEKTCCSYFLRQWSLFRVTIVCVGESETH